MPNTKTNDPGSIVNSIISSEVIIRGIINDYMQSHDPAHKMIAFLLSSLVQIIDHQNSQLIFQNEQITNLKLEVDRLSAAPIVEKIS